MGLHHDQQAERNSLSRCHTNLLRRVFEHREGITKKYALERLVYAERREDIRTAIQRERTLKHWPRRWKVRLILDINPDWQDLTDSLL